MMSKGLENMLKNIWLMLQNRLAEAEESGRRSRSSLDAVSRRRQSLHDSKRLFDESEGNSKC